MYVHRRHPTDRRGLQRSSVPHWSEGKRPRYRAAAPASEAGPSAPRRLASNWSRTPNGPALEQYILLTGSIHALRARDRFCWTCPVATCKRRVLKPYFAPMPLGSLDLLNLYIIVNVNSLHDYMYSCTSSGSLREGVHGYQRKVRARRGSLGAGGRQGRLQSAACMRLATCDGESRGCGCGCGAWARGAGGCNGAEVAILPHTLQANPALRVVLQYQLEFSGASD